MRARHYSQLGRAVHAGTGESTPLSCLSLRAYPPSVAGSGDPCQSIVKDRNLEESSGFLI